MRQDNYWYLEQVDLYDMLCPTKLSTGEDDREYRYYSKGEFIYMNNDESQKIYLIADGKVKIGYYTDKGEEVVKAILSKGEIFGELAMLGEDKRSDFAQAIEDKTVLCPHTVDDMHNLMHDHKPFSLYVHKTIGDRMKRLERRLELLVFKDARTRLVEFIKDMAKEVGQSVGYETLIEHDYTQKDIADLIGTTRQTVTTLLNDMKEHNLINFSRKRILVRDLEKLK